MRKILTAATLVASSILATQVVQANTESKDIKTEITNVEFIEDLKSLSESGKLFFIGMIWSSMINNNNLTDHKDISSKFEKVTLQELEKVADGLLSIAVYTQLAVYLGHKANTIELFSDPDANYWINQPLIPI